MPVDSLLKDDKGEVTGRQNSTVTINSDEIQRGDAVGYEVISFSGKEWNAREISGDEVNFDNGEVVFEDGSAGLSAGTLKVAEGAVVKATRKLLIRKTRKE